MTEQKNLPGRPFSKTSRQYYYKSKLKTIGVFLVSLEKGTQKHALEKKAQI